MKFCKNIDGAHLHHKEILHANIHIIGAKCRHLGGSAPPQVWSLWEAVVLGSGAVEEAVVWQDSTQTYRSQLNPKII